MVWSENACKELPQRRPHQVQNPRAKTNGLAALGLVEGRPQAGQYPKLGSSTSGNVLNTALISEDLGSI